MQLTTTCLRLSEYTAKIKYFNFNYSTTFSLNLPHKTRDSDHQRIDYRPPHLGKENVMAGKIVAFAVLVITMHSAHAGQIEKQSSYVSNGLNEIATWIITDGKVQPQTICIREKVSVRFMKCLDGAREIFAYGCLAQANDSYCDAYRWISKKPEYLNYRRQTYLNAPFSTEAKKIDPNL